MRLLANEIRDGESRRGVLVLAQDYDLRAEVLERGTPSTVVQRRQRSRPRAGRSPR